MKFRFGVLFDHMFHMLTLVLCMPNCSFSTLANGKCS